MSAALPPELRMAHLAFLSLSLFLAISCRNNPMVSPKRETQIEPLDKNVLGLAGQAGEHARGTTELNVFAGRLTFRPLSVLVCIY